MIFKKLFFLLRTKIFVLLCVLIATNVVGITGFYDKMNKNRKAIKKIVIDAGHGGHDPGAVGKLYKEKDIALSIALKLGEQIKSNLPGVQVIFTRDSDIFLPLHIRTRIANEAKADLFISIHCNFAVNREAYGTETFVMGVHTAQENLEVARRENSSILLETNFEANYGGYDPNSPVGHIILSNYQNAFLTQSIDFANLVEKQLTAKKYSQSRGVKQAGFIVLKRATMPSVLVEAGFLSHENEEKYLGMAEGQSQIAHALFLAIKEWASVEPLDDLAKSLEDQAMLKRSDSTSYSRDDVQIASQPLNPDTDGYWVQLAVIRAGRNIDLPTEIPISSIKILEIDGLKKYQFGKFETLDEARKAKIEVAQYGFKDAFIVRHGKK